MSRAMNHNSPNSLPTNLNPYALDLRYSRLCANGAAEFCGSPNPAFWLAWKGNAEEVRQLGFRPKREADGWLVYFYVDPATCGMAAAIALAPSDAAPRILREGELPLIGEHSSQREVSLREVQLEVVAVKRKWLSVRYVGGTSEYECLRVSPLEAPRVGECSSLLVRWVCDRTGFGVKVTLEPVPESEAIATISSGLAELLRRMDNEWRNRHIYRLGSAATLRGWGVASFPEHMAAFEKMEQRLEKMPRLDLHVAIPEAMQIRDLIAQFNCVEVVADNIVKGQARVLKNPRCRRVHVPPARLEQLAQTVRDWIAAHPSPASPPVG